MARRKLLPRKKVLIPLLVVFLVLGAFGGKFLYNKLREPAFYSPNGEAHYILPMNLLPSGQIIEPKEPETKAVLPGAKWVPQTFNNCGPATTSMILQYFGYNVSQAETKAHLRTGDDDKNVFTYEIADYLRNDYGISSKLLYGGNIQILKKLIANGFYVMIEDFLHPNDDIGHFVIIRGYDDEQRVLIADDSFIGANITYPYDEFVNAQWKAFNYEYLPVYKPESEELVKAIIGSVWDSKTMYKLAAEKAQKEINNNNSDMFAWFNLGTSLYGLADYNGAKQAFEKSRSLGWPFRMLWYQIQPIQTYNALKEYQNVIQVADLALAGNDSFAEALSEKEIAYRGLAQEFK